MERGNAVERSVSGVALRIRLAREGRSEALNELLGMHRNYLRLLAANCLDPGLRVKADASDVVQDTLAQAAEGFAGFRGTTEAEWLGWVRSILANRLAGLGRRYATRRRDHDRERAIAASLGRSSLVLEGFLASSGPSPSQAAQEHERMFRVADALADLDPEDRDVLILRTFQDLDWAAVAQRMNRTPDAARMLWTRALARAGRRLKGLAP
jgi:RNA polymerase sigma-70 factor (ECF subfamily)